MEYEMKCEIRCCSICGEWIDRSDQLVIIKRKHYHKNCIILCRESLCKSLLVEHWNPSAPSFPPSPH